MNCVLGSFMGIRTYLRRLKGKLKSQYQLFTRKLPLPLVDRSENHENMHCFLDDIEVGIKECSENSKGVIVEPINAFSYSQTEAPAIAEKEIIEADIVIPDGSNLEKIIVQGGSIIEKVYKSPSGEMVCLKFIPNLRM